VSLSSQHHSFDIKLAAMYGVEEAILIHHFQHWIRINAFAGRNFKEGKTWTYQSRKDIQAHFPYWNVDRVKYLCEKLEALGVVKTANFNKSPVDKTLWYAFVDEEAFGVDRESSNNFYERQKCPSKGKSALPEGKSAQPIPDSINTDAKPTHEEKRKETKEKGGAPPAPLPFKEPEEFFSKDDVKMPKKDYSRLLQKYGQDLIDSYVTQLALYAKMKPREFKKYVDHAAVIESWILKNEGKSWTKSTTQSKSGNYNPTSSDKDSSELQFLSPDSLKEMLKKYSNGAPDKKGS